MSPLKETLGEFSKLKKMLEECIDIAKAKSNDYIINPEFSPDLKSLSVEISKIKKKMDYFFLNLWQTFNLNKRKIMIFRVK